MEKETVKKIHDTLESLMQQVRGISERVDNIEKTPITPSISEESVKKLEEKINRFSKGNEDYDDDDLGISEVKGKLPKKFSTNEIPKFKPTDNPKYHLRAFKSAMALQGVDTSLYATVFPHSLDHSAQQWFFHLEAKDIEDWEDIAFAFKERYKLNVDMKTTERELEVLKQREDEGFTAFYTRWRGVAAKMVDIPKESLLVRMFIKNLQPNYNKVLKFLGLTTFEAVYNIGIDVEDDLAKNKASTSHDNNKGKKHDTSSSNHVNNVNDVWTIDEARAQRQRRELTPIGMTYDEAFDRLFGKGLVKPIGPTEDPAPEKRSSRWNLNSYSKYHQGNGHTTNQCFRFQNLVQDLIEANKLPIPPSAKKSK